MSVSTCTEEHCHCVDGQLCFFARDKAHQDENIWSFLLCNLKQGLQRFEREVSVKGEWSGGHMYSDWPTLASGTVLMLE